ncbi:MAG: ATP-binding protein [Litorimonas sp.]
MLNVIRNNTQEPPTRWKVPLIVIALACVILLCIAAALIFAATLEMSGFILLGGVGLVALLGLLSVRRMQENKHLQNRRQSSRANLYSHAFFSSANPSVIVRDGKPIHANKVYYDLAKFLGVFLNDQNSPSVERLFTSAGKEAAASIFRLHHMGETSSRTEEVIDLIAPDESLRRYSIQVSRLPELSGHFLWEIIDITDMGAAEEGLLSDAPVGLFAVDETGKVLTTNDVLKRWLGGDDAMMPKHMSEFIENPKALLDSPAQVGRIVRTDARLMTRKGVITPTLMVGTWKTLSSGTLAASVALYGHSTLAVSANPDEAQGVNVETSRANTGVDQNSKLTDCAARGENLSAAPVAVLQVQGKKLGTAKIKSANAAFERMSQQTDWQDMSFGKIFKAKAGEHRFLQLEPSKCSAARPYDAILAGELNLAVSTYIVMDDPDSADGVGVDGGLPSDVFWVYLVDISERKSLEDQLVQSQKMQAIGQLAAGVAHDFNNLLTAIRLNTDELLQRHPVGDPSYPELQNINTTGARAGALVKKLLAFSRKQTRRMERLNITDALSDMVMTLKQTLGERAKLTMVHERGLPPVMADKSQIDTILMNLCVNARDAMEEQGGGSIEVRSALMPRKGITDTVLREALRGIAGDDFVVISVKDTGTGMSDEVKAKIFEPFFTTKDLGKGTGLGLATVYGIVQQSGGHLDVQSELGVGTTFRIFLPAADGDVVLDTIVAKPAPAARKPSDLAGQGTILFVEDEASVRDIAAKSLRKKGYKVIEAEDGEEALEILEDSQSPFDLMISDVVMPGLGGPELLKQGRSMLGEARIVFISGYAEEEFSELLSEEPDVTFLPKPFTLAQLAEKVKMEIGEVT